jgi:chemotaxis signal transduction protein
MSDTSLFEKLGALEREARALRAQVVAQEAPLSTVELGVLAVRVGGLTVCFALEAIDEVVPVAAVSPLTGAPPWVPGVLDRAGALIPVIDVLARLEGRAREPELDEKIILARAEGRRVGLVVQELLGLRKIPAGALNAAPAHAEFAPFLTGLVPLEDGHAPLLSPALLLYVSAVPPAGNAPA